MEDAAEKSELKTLEAFYRFHGFDVDLVDPAGKKKQGKEKEQRDWYQKLCEDKYPALFHLGFLTRQEWMSPSIAYLHRISDLLIRKISSQPDLEFARGDTEVYPAEEELILLKEEVPFVNGSEFVDDAWLLHLWKQLLLSFQAEIKVYDGTAASFLTEYNSNINVAGRVFFHLVESGDDETPFAFMATYSTKPEKSKKAVHTPLKNALIEFKKDQAKLLSLMSAVAKAADQSSFISELMESGELFSPLRLTVEEAYTFLREIPLYEESGIMCRVPDWWRKHTNSIKLAVSVGDKTPTKVGLDAIMDFQPSLLMGEEKMTEKQIREFLTMAEGLILYKGKWIEIDKKKLETALEALEKVKKWAEEGYMTLTEAMRLELNLAERLEKENGTVEISVTNGQWLREIKDRLSDPKKLPAIEKEPTLHAELRHYQEEGYQWLNTMGQLGFGACLADDMGLGKTVQMIAYLEHYRIQRGGHALLILPASLIGNWQKEIEKFAPELPYQTLHKSAVKSGTEIQVDESKFLCITTYGMVARLAQIGERKWDILILDEAQAIKNAGTAQTKSVKAIPAAMRIAMTGTPIENRLGDLWSLFDFLNKGLLGTAKEFTAFTKGLGEDEMGYGRLRKIVNPFILRRLKTDRSIITDLPEKIEIREYAELTGKQILLYQKLLNEISVKLRTTEGIDRKGLVMASIMKFKQICNHPDQFLGMDEYKRKSSGKFGKLEAICETIYEKRERVLVFTQFREMAEPLSDILAEIFHRKGFVLHGGTPVKKRSEMVARFNGEEYIPYMVLSLKAGGVGLNLTAANHVIHFDRWWNPAVENQATDRAFRIGQTKNVMVHKFITEGTIEEKIDAMIEEKQKLAGDILGASGEQWITELDNDQLMDLFQLGGDRA